MKSPPAPRDPATPEEITEMVRRFDTTLGQGWAGRAADPAQRLAVDDEQ